MSVTVCPITVASAAAPAATPTVVARSMTAPAAQATAAMPLAMSGSMSLPQRAAPASFAPSSPTVRSPPQIANRPRVGSAPAACLTASPGSPLAGALSPNPVATKKKVLAFGDSLTTGLVRTGHTRPYTATLSALLGPSVEVVNRGFCGEKAAEMMPRLQKELDDARALGQPVTHVVLLAGTNDLRDNASPDAVLAHLVNLQNLVRREGVSCIAVTVPRFGPRDAVYFPMKEIRARVNDRLRSMASAFAEGRPGAPAVYLADIDRVVDALAPQAQADLFADGVHFMDRGYDLLGEVVHAAICKIPDLAPQASPSMPSRAVPPTPPPLPALAQKAAATAWRMPLTPSPMSNLRRNYVHGYSPCTMVRA